jgi:arsenical pump membrane protein
VRSSVLALALLTRSLPVRAVPIEATVVAAGLAAITAAAAPHLRLDSVLGGTGLAAQATTFASGVVGANAVNNLPALLVGLPSLPRDTTWAFLAGVNTGPTLWISGSLAGLLWADIMRHHGHPVTPAAYARVGVRVGLPALLATLAVLLADAALRSGISGSPW